MALDKHHLLLATPGPTGATGATGATGPQGPAGSAVNPRGAYAGGTTYAQFDGVTDAGIAYISLQSSNTGHTPASSPTWWQAVGSSSVTGSILSSAYRATGNVSCANSATTAISMDTNLADVGGVHSTSTNPTRFTVPTSGDGYYLVAGGVRFDVVGSPSLSTVMEVVIRKNGTTTLFTQSSVTSGTNIVKSVMGFASLVAGDYVEVCIFQNSGGALNVIGGVGQQVFGQIMRLS